MRRPFLPTSLGAGSWGKLALNSMNGGYPMRYLLTVAILAATIAAAAAPAYAGRTVCTTYGNRTTCNYTPTCTHVWVNGQLKQICN